MVLQKENSQEVKQAYQKLGTVGSPLSLLFFVVHIKNRTNTKQK
jgi:hypothetical protein